MMRLRWDRATEAEALGALLGVWTRHGLDTFCLNPRGPLAGPLLLARHFGWLWGDGQGMHVTLAGVCALSEHLGSDLIGEWIDAERRWASEPGPGTTSRWPDGQASLVRDRYAVAAE